MSPCGHWSGAYLRRGKVRLTTVCCNRPAGHDGEHMYRSDTAARLLCWDDDRRLTTKLPPNMEVSGLA